MTQYIDKDAVVAEINRRNEILINTMNKIYYASNYNEWMAVAKEYRSLVFFINALEVKEVDLGKEFDLNKEIDEQIRLLGGVHKLDNNSKRWYTGTYEELFHFARHFIELGFKVKSMFGNNDSNPSYKKFD